MNWLKSLLGTIGWLLWPTMSEMRRRQGVPKNENPPTVPPKDSVFQLGIFINGQFVGCTNPMAFRAEGTLDAQLKSAIESENYEEAARLRDLINKK